MHNVVGGVCVCEECTEKIITLHVSTRPLKTLCPYCYGKEGNTEKCDYCDLPSIVEKSDNE